MWRRRKDSVFGHPHRRACALRCAQRTATKRGAGKQSTGLFSFPPVQIPSTNAPSKRASRWDALLLGREGAAVQGGLKSGGGDLAAEATVEPAVKNDAKRVGAAAKRKAGEYSMRQRVPRLLCTPLESSWRFLDARLLRFLAQAQRRLSG